MYLTKKQNIRSKFLFFSIDGHNDFELNKDFRNAIARNKISYPLDQFEEKKYTEYDKEEYINLEKEQYNKILKYLLDSINEQLIPVENLNINFKKVYNYKKRKIIEFLQKTIKEEKIITDKGFASLLIHLNNKWIKSFEISYYIRFIIEYVDSELVWKNLLYSEFRKLPHYPYGSQKANGCKEIYKFNFFWKYKDNDAWILKFYPLNKRKFKQRTIQLNKKETDFIFNKNYRTNYIKHSLKHEDISYFRCYDKFKKPYWRYDSSELEERKFALVKQELREEWFGNKWKREQILFENTKTVLSNKNIPVLNRFSPEELKKQHLDIYFEYRGKKFGIEHQGEQHYKPVEFFGGRKGYNYRVKLDKLKKMRCKKAKINLIEFGYFEEINKLAIIKKLKKFGMNLNYERRVYA